MESESTLLRPVPSFSTSLTVPAPVTTSSPSCSGLSARAEILDRGAAGQIDLGGAGL